MMVKNAGHGNIFHDKQGRWWCTAFDHVYTDQWSLWLVPIDFEMTDDDVTVHVKDERFRPTAEDQKVVEELARTGRPSQWEGKAPWWRPEP